MQKTVKQFLKMEVTLLGNLPMISEVPSANRQHTAFVDQFNESEVAIALRPIAAQLCESHDENKIALIKLGSLLAHQLTKKINT